MRPLATAIFCNPCAIGDDPAADGAAYLLTPEFLSGHRIERIEISPRIAENTSPRQWESSRPDDRVVRLHPPLPLARVRIDRVHPTAPL